VYYYVTIFRCSIVGSQIRWVEENKILNIIRAIDEGFDAVIEYIREDKISKLIPIYESTPIPPVIPTIRYGSALIPIEPVGEYRLRDLKDILQGGSEKIVDFLEKEEISVVAVDSGTYVSGPHVSIDFAIVNVGYWYFNYGEMIGGGGNKARIFVDVEEGTKIQTLAKELEIGIVEELMDRIHGKKVFVLLDESLSLSYTLSWAEKDRLEIISKISRLLNSIKSRGAIPIGIFYTRAHDIVRGLSVLRPDTNITRVPDRALMDRILGLFGRSQLFMAHSRAIEGSGLRILAFYTKVGERNILRVEFPEDLRAYVDDIHFIVVAQSMLGGGYPLPLQRAHDWAVIDAETREFVIGEICRRLGIPLSEVLYTKKLTRKRTPME